MAIAWRDFGIVMREMLERQIDGIKYVWQSDYGVSTLSIVGTANGWQMDGKWMASAGYWQSDRDIKAMLRNSPLDQSASL